MITPNIRTLVVRDDVPEIVRLLKSGALTLADVDVDRRTLLHTAVSAEAHRLTKVLITLGADLSARNKYGMGPLSDASRIGNLAALAPLLNAGADPNEKDVRGFTPMHHAILCGGPNVREMLSVLLRFGADLDSRNADGFSAKDWILRNDAYRSLLD